MKFNQYLNSVVIAVFAFCCFTYLSGVACLCVWCNVLFGSSQISDRQHLLFVKFILLHQKLLNYNFINCNKSNFHVICTS